jgi:hypothetical protein
LVTRSVSEGFYATRSLAHASGFQSIGTWRCPISTSSFAIGGANQAERHGLPNATFIAGLLMIKWSDWCAGVNEATRNNLCAEPATMSQSILNPSACQLFEIATGLAEFDTSKDNIANCELDADQMV